MNGILLVDKPEGWTSFDVVAKVRNKVAHIEGKKARQVKVGHTGTLAPAATGLLQLCVGKKFTSRVPNLIKQDKVYEVELTLGATSTTGDKEGEITDREITAKPSDEDILRVINQFIGEQQQTPPAYSAVKIDGKRSYELARQGKQIKHKPRTITIYSIDNVEYSWPKITFTTKVSSGTYIRVLAEDIGKKLNTGAYMSALRRTAIGEQTIDSAMRIEDLTDEYLSKTLA